LQFKEFSAGDHVGGTLGTGSSGILTLTILILIYYLVVLKSSFKKQEKKILYFFSYTPFLIPLILNETKISFILIPILILTLINPAQIKSLVGAISVGTLLIALLINNYSDQGKKYNNPIKEIFNEDFLESYLLSKDDKY
jgi:hypothetical protein